MLGAACSTDFIPAVCPLLTGIESVLGDQNTLQFRARAPQNVCWCSARSPLLIPLIIPLQNEPTLFGKTLFSVNHVDWH